MSEQKVKTLTIHDKTVIGCVNNSAEAMLSVQFEVSEEIHDIFLSDSNLDSLHNESGRVIQRNTPEKRSHEAIRKVCLDAIRAAEQAAHDFFVSCDVGPERDRAYQVYENIRVSTRVG